MDAGISGQTHAMQGYAGLDPRNQASAGSREETALIDKLKAIAEIAGHTDDALGSALAGLRGAQPEQAPTGTAREPLTLMAVLELIREVMLRSNRRAGELARLLHT